MALVAVLPVCAGGLVHAEPDRFVPERLRPGNPRSVAAGFDLIPLGYTAESSAKMAGVDIDRDGQEEIAIASAKELVVIRYRGHRNTFLVWRTKARGGATAVGSGDVDGDGFRDLVVGWGAHRDTGNAPARLVAYRTGDAPEGALIEETIRSPETTRNQFGTITVSPLEADGPAGVLYTHYTSKYQVRGAYATLSAGSGAGKWSSRTLFERRMGGYATVARLGPQGGRFEIFVGRPYGDEPKSHGDVAWLDKSGAWKELPSIRGVRGLAGVVVGGSSTPRYRVCYGDGWHWRYREKAVGLVTCAAMDEKGEITTELVESTNGSEINTIGAADLDGDGVKELIARGSKAMYRYIPVVAIDGVQSWDPRIIGPGGRGFAVVDLDGDGRDEIALGGEKPALLMMR